MGRPFLKRQDNLIEFSNEYWTVLLCFHIFCFTDWVPYPDIQYRVGFSMVAVTLWIMAFNLQIMVHSSCRGLSRKCKGIRMTNRYKSEMKRLEQVKKI
jgi:hypothetical protein